jgi:raffinose/stachyose/melibiose transport system substrate-binding protein
MSTAAKRQQTKPHQDSVTLNVVSVDAVSFGAQIMKGNFERVYPDIKINLQILSIGPMGTLYATTFRAGNPPDVSYFVPGRGALYSPLNYADAGYLVDLAGRPLEKRIPQPLLVGTKTGKHLWGYTTGLAVYGVMYSIDMFKQLGVTVPTTFAQWLDTCRKISAAGKIPIAAAIGDGRAAPIMLTLAANDVYAANPNWNAERAHGKVSFANSGWRKAFEQLVQMKDAKCFSPGTVGTGSVVPASQFATGDAASYVAQTAGFSLWLSINPKLNFGMFPIPAEKPADQRLLLNPTDSWSVSSATTGATRDAALKFIDFIARPKQTDTMNKAIGELLSGPQLKTLAVGPDQPRLRSVAPLLKRKNTINQTIIWPNPLVLPALNAGMVGLFTGQKTIDQALADMDAAFNKGVGATG